MNIESLRHEFLIYVIDEEPLAKVLLAGHFQVEKFANNEIALLKIKENPPHIIITAASSQFLTDVKNLSQDIQLIFTIKNTERKLGAEVLAQGAFLTIEKPFSEMNEILSLADRTIEKIYLNLENEQLLEKLNQKPISAGSFVNEFLEKTADFYDINKTIQCLLDELSETVHKRPVIFLKYVPSYQSLVVAASSQIPLDDIRTVGIKLDRYDSKIISQMLCEPDSFTELKELMDQVFKAKKFRAFPLKHEAKPQGLIVVFEDIEFATIKVLEAVTGTAYNLTMLNSKIREMTIKDFLTGLYNRKYFNDKLEEEMNRSRRTHYPLSLIYLNIDNFKKYNDVSGHLMGDIVVKAVAQIIAKTSRKTDIVVRLGGDEFAILCPHTPGVGAAIKAEKIRMTVENAKFPQTESIPQTKITLSVGVSEYPTIVSDSLLLVRAANDALFKVKQGGKNRVCLAEAPKGFVPDFEPLPVPGFQALPKSNLDATHR